MRTMNFSVGSLFVIASIALGLVSACQHSDQVGTPGFNPAGDPALVAAYNASNISLKYGQLAVSNYNGYLSIISEENSCQLASLYMTEIRRGDFVASTRNYCFALQTQAQVSPLTAEVDCDVAVQDATVLAKAVKRLYDYCATNSLGSPELARAVLAAGYEHRTHLGVSVPRRQEVLALLKHEVPRQDLGQDERHLGRRGATEPRDESRESRETKESREHEREKE